MPADRRLLLSLYACLCALVLAGILYFSHGHFAYALDDTYIYLALAENLPEHLSINAPGQEVGAAASSILYPYLLMPFIHTGLALYIPLLINLAAGAAVLLMLLRLEDQLNLLPALSGKQKALCIFAFALLMNITMLVFCGMEHTLHLLSALAIFSGLLWLCENKTTPRWWFWLAIAAGPLLRYEALALSLLAAVYASCLGQWRKAVPAAGLALAGPVLFGFYLHSQGFSWLPSSVLSKSDVLTVTTEGVAILGFVTQMASNAITSLAERPTAGVHLALLLIMAGLLLWRTPTAAQRGLLAVVLLAALAHLLLGKFGWWGRYHVYVLALQLLVMAYVAKPLLLRLKVPALGLLLLAGSASLFYSVQVPAAAGQIYRNHGLLNIFLTKYWQDSVGAYDVGYISWRNEHEVLDLFGLASERVRRIIRTPLAGLVVPQLLAQKQIGLVIAQADFADYYWQPQWQHFAELQLDGRHVVTTNRQVFYLLDPARADELRSKLKAFAAELPADVHLQLPD